MEGLIWDGAQNGDSQLSAGLAGFCMPSLRQMKEGGRPDLVYAVGKWGGVKTVASQLGIPTRKSRYACWQIKVLHQKGRSLSGCWLTLLSIQLMY